LQSCGAVMNGQLNQVCRESVARFGHIVRTDCLLLRRRIAPRLATKVAGNPGGAKWRDLLLFSETAVSKLLAITALPAASRGRMTPSPHQQKVWVALGASLHTVPPLTARALACSVMRCSGLRVIVLMKVSRRKRAADQSSSIATLRTGSNPKSPRICHPRSWSISLLYRFEEPFG
jgi:hypothetical protein